MSWEVTPRTWTIDVSEPSYMAFTITNNNDVAKRINIAHTEHFHCHPNRRYVDAGSTNKFFVKYLANDSIGNLRLVFCDDNAEWFSILIDSKTTNTNFEAKHQEQNSEFLECKICLLKYDERERAPRMLTCGHTLCSECAERLWKVQNRQRINCPFDRTVTTLPNSQLGINNLPKNFSLLEMLESQKKPAIVKPLTNSEPSDTPCVEDPCHEATVFCATCGVDFCEKCYAQGHTLKIFQSHKKLLLSEKPVQLPKCPRHPHNTAEFECKESSCSQPSKMFCHTCLLQEHKEHSYEHLLQISARNQRILEVLLTTACSKMERLQHVAQTQEMLTASYQPNSPMLLKRRNDLIEQFELKKRKVLSDFDSGVDIRKQECQKLEENWKSQSRNVSEVRKEIEKILKSKVNLFRIDDVAKRATACFGEKVSYSVGLDNWDIRLNEKMELTWVMKK